MRKQIGSYPIGGMAHLAIVTEDRWIYPQITLFTHQGESSTLFLQHISPNKLNELGDFCKEMACKLEARNEISSD